MTIPQEHHDFVREGFAAIQRLVKSQDHRDNDDWDKVLHATRIIAHGVKSIKPQEREDAVQTVMLRLIKKVDFSTEQNFDSIAHFNNYIRLALNNMARELARNNSRREKAYHNPLAAPKPGRSDHDALIDHEEAVSVIGRIIAQFTSQNDVGAFEEIRRHAESETPYPQLDGTIPGHTGTEGMKTRRHRFIHGVREAFPEVAEGMSR